MAGRQKKIKRIAIITGSRAEYGILRPVMTRLKENLKFELFTVVLGMHLSKEFGNTINEIKKDGFKISGKIMAINQKDTNTDMAKYVGEVIIETVSVMKKIKPDVALLLGDRADIFAAVIACAYMNIAIAHIHGGDVSGGGLDEPARHAITKFANLHLVATQNSAKRIAKMGEDKKRIFVVGAPGLDTILNEPLLSPKEISIRYGLDPSRPVLLVVQHPVTTDSGNAAYQIKQTMEALKYFKYQAIVIYPNADAGGRRMIKIIEKYRKYPFIHIYRTIPHRDYLSIMNIASVMIGNSSSGIIEAASFRLPVINIGPRQYGRERTCNVIDVGYDTKQIISTMGKCLHDKKFRQYLNKCRSPYGNGTAGKKIVKIFSRITINDRLLQKQITH